MCDNISKFFIQEKYEHIQIEQLGKLKEIEIEPNKEHSNLGIDIYTQRCIQLFES